MTEHLTSMYLGFGESLVKRGRVAETFQVLLALLEMMEECHCVFVQFKKGGAASDTVH